LSAPTVADLYHAAIDGLPDRQLDIYVTVSMRLSCGCTTPPSEPLPVVDARTRPGGVVICDRCDDYTVVTRTTTRMVEG
jgi:hypothetical protein